MDQGAHDQPTFNDGAADIELRSGDVCVRPATRELIVEGQPVAIERRAYDLLVYLMLNADKVVDKDELFREVWHSRPVSEGALPQAVSRVRKVLGGDSDDWLATVYGVGYRFAQPVERIDHSHAKGSKAGTRRPSRSPWPMRIGLALGLCALLVSLWLANRQPAPTELTIAVLPVQNETGDAQLDWVELGVLPLIDKALEEGGVQRVSTNNVLATLRRYPDAKDAQARARVLKLNANIDQVVVPRLYVAENGFRLEVSSAEAENRDFDSSYTGDDIAVLAVAAGTSLADSLARWKGAERAQSTFVTDDPFVNQAFVRGLDARLRGQWEEAARYFDTVLVAAPDLLEAKFHLALVTRYLGDWDYAEQLNAELMTAAEASGEREMLAAVQSISGTLAWRRGNKDAAENWYKQALENYTQAGNANYIASTKANLGILAATRGNFSLAEEHMRHALDHYKASGDRYYQAQTQKNIGSLLVDQGRYDEAESVLLESLEIRRSLELPLQVALTLSALADVEMVRGHWDQALAYQESVLQAAIDHDSPTLEIQARADLSAALRRLGRLTEAVAAATAAYTQATELGSPTNQAVSLLQQGRAELDRRLPGLAETLFSRAADIYAEIQEPLGESLARMARIAALVSADRLTDAQEELERATTLIQQSELDHLLPDLHRAEAQLAGASGDQRGAVEKLEVAYAAAQASQNPIDLLDIGGQLGLTLLDHAADSTALPELASKLAASPEASADALAFLARYHASTDPQRALAWAERRRALMGEGWTSSDDEALDALRRRAGEGL